MYIDEDNTFSGEGVCDAGWVGEYPFILEGEVQEDGEAIGTASADLPSGDSVVELAGEVNDDGIFLDWALSLGPIEVNGYFESD